MKLSTSLAVILLPILLLVSIGATYFYYQTAENILKEQVYYHLETTAQSRADHIEAFLTEQKHEVEIAATHKELTNEELIEIIDLENHFYELFTLDNNGKVMATTNPKEEIREDFSDEFIFIEGRKTTYVKDFSYDDEFDMFGMVISTPHAGGVLVARVDMEELDKITTDRTGLGESGEAYIVNKEDYMITLSRFKQEEVILEQKIDSINSRNCLSMKGHPKEHIEHKPVEVFLDYRGERVLGTHVYLPEMQWCLLVEIDEAEILERIKDYYFNELLITVISITLSVILIRFFIGNYFDKKDKEKKIKRFPCGIRRKFQPWYCKLMRGKCATYPKGRCGMVIKTRNLFINLKLSHSILIALIFAIGYFFLIKLIFNRMIYSLIIFGLLSFIIGFLIFSYGFKLKYSKSRKYLFLGSGAIVVYPLVHIPMEQYFNLVKPFNVLYWTPTIILYVLGFILLLNFLEDSAK